MLIKQVVAPFDRRPQRLLPGIDAAAGLEKLEPFGETGKQLLGGKDSHAGGGELERERQVIQLSAELLNDWAGLEPGIRRPRPSDEELDRILSLKRRDRICLLTGKAKHLAARYEQLTVRACGDHLRQVTGCIDEMLEVVENQEKPSVSDALSQTVCGPKRLSGRFEHELRVA